jgi:hypothetical protein
MKSMNYLNSSGQTKVQPTFVPMPPNYAKPDAKLPPNKKFVNIPSMRPVVPYEEDVVVCGEDPGMGVSTPPRTPK